MKQKRFCVAVIFFQLLSLFLNLSASAESHQYLNYSGRIFNPKGLPLDSSNVSFILSIYSPGAEKCLLYQETQSLDMSNSKGVFSLSIGKGTRNDGGSHSMIRVFTNSGTLTNLSCASGGTSFSPGASDDRILEAKFSEAGVPAGTVSLHIKAVPFALQAQEISGYGILNLGKINGIGSAKTITPSGWDKLVDLGDGTFDFDLNNKKITNLAPPINDTDASTKKYVDDALNLATSGAVSNIASLANAKVWIGDGSGKAQEQALSGDISLTNAGVATVKLGGRTVNSVAPNPNDVLKWNNATSKWEPAADAGITVESDPSVAAFAKAALPTCNPGEVLKGNGSNLSCVSDNTTDATKLPLAGGTMGGAIDMGGYSISNLGDLSLNAQKTLLLGTFSDAQEAGINTVGKFWYNNTSNVIKYYDGTSIKTLGIAGAGILSLNGLSGNTQTFAMGSSGNAPAFSSAGSTHTLNIPMASAGGSVTAGLLSNAEYAAINTAISGKLGAVSNTASLTDTKVWIGDGSGKAQEQALSGDISLTNAGVVTVDKIKNQSISAAGSSAGQMLRYAGANTWTPGFVAMTDLRSTVTGSNQFASSCSSNQTLTYNSVGDIMSCTNIAISNAQVSGLGGAATLNVGTTAGTVAAGDDARITGALQTSGGTMTGAINMGGYSISNLGDLSLNAQKTLLLGTFSDAQEAGINTVGKFWYNNTSNVIKYYDGTSIKTLGIAGANGLSGNTQTFAMGMGSYEPPILLDNFDSSQPFSAVGCSAGSVANSITRITSSSANPYIYRSVTAFPGSTYKKIRIRYKRISGSNTTGRIFFEVSGVHTYDAGYYKDFTWDMSGNWADVVIDMSSLTVGGTDWITHNITGIRIDFPFESGAVVDVDFIAVEKTAYGDTGPTGATGLSGGVVGGRVTLESGVPISTTDQTSKSTVYWTPDEHGDNFPLWDGSAWVWKTGQAEKALVLSGLTSGKNYDLVLYDNSGTAYLDLLPAWTSDTARSSAIERKNGRWVNSAAATTVINGFSLSQYRGLVVGTLRTTGTTTTEDSNAKRFLVSFYNRAWRLAHHAETTASWTYTTSAWRKQNNSSANRIEWIDPLGDLLLSITNKTLSDNTSTNVTRYIAVAIDSETVPTSTASGTNTVYPSATGYVSAIVTKIVGLGYHYAAALEFSNGGGTTTWFGNGPDNIFISSPLWI